jgi:hypothetical protein
MKKLVNPIQQSNDLEIKTKQNKKVKKKRRRRRRKI